MPNTFVEEQKKALEEEHDRLVEELKSFARPDPRMKDDWDAQFPQFGTEEGSGPASHDALEQAGDEVEEYETRIEAEHSLESRLLEVNKALSRIKEGNYGICLACKKEISPERLKANPAAEFHTEHTPK